MTKLIQAAIVVIIYLVIVIYMLPHVTGGFAWIVGLLVTIGAIVGLMKIGGLWFE